VGPSCETKPISEPHPSAGLLHRRHTCAHKQSQFSPGPAVKGAGRAARTTGGVNCAKQSQSGPHRPKKALAGRTGKATAGRGNRAKQSQFHRSGRTGKYLVQNELWRIEHARDLRKTKPIPAGTALGRDRPRCRGRRWERVVQTKPICPAPTPRGAGPRPEMGPPAETNVRNKANSPPGRHDGSGTDNCERSAAIRPHTPAAPRSPGAASSVWEIRSHMVQ